MLDVCLLGTGGMMPLPNRYLTALLTRTDGRLLLIDCGEGTQCAMKEAGWGYKNVDAVCFTHFHADHISGLPGLLLTIAATERSEPILMIGPPGLESVVRSLCVIAPELPFRLKFMELPYDGRADVEIPGTDYRIDALPVEHTRTTFAYNVRVERAGKFDLRRAERLGLPKQLWGKLQAGGAVEHEGKTYTPDMVLGARRRGIKVSYCTDTRPTAKLPDFVKGADLFVCEGLYGDPGKQSKAASHGHMIYREAAEIAKAGGVSELWLTHFSPAMPAPKEFLPNAAAVFENVRTGKDGLTKTILFQAFL